MSSLMFLEACKAFSNKYQTIKDSKQAAGSNNENDQKGNSHTKFVLDDAIHNVLENILKDKQHFEKVNRFKIPINITKVSYSTVFKGLLEGMLEYCRELFRLENKQNNLEIEAKERGIKVPILLQSEKKKLSDLASKMSQRYSQLIFQYRTVPDEEMQNCHSFLQFKSQIMLNQKQEKNFFESLYYIASNVLKQGFPKDEHLRLDEEICRLFRSNTFNTSMRRQNEEQKLSIFPQLGEAPPQETSQDMIVRLNKRYNLSKEIIASRLSPIRARSDIRPVFATANNSPQAAAQNRSPIASIQFPSLKDKIKIYQDESEKINKSHMRSMRNQKLPYKTEMDKIIDDQTFKMNKKGGMSMDITV